VSHESVWTLALGHLGHTGEVVTDWELPDSNAQNVLAIFYATAREMALGLHDWSFARKRHRPANVTATKPPSPEWQFTWTMPADIVAMRGFTVERPLRRVDRIAYEIVQDIVDPAAKVMYTNVDPFMSVDYMIYTRRLTDAEDNLFTTQFESVLAAVLAAEASLSLGKDLQFQRSMYDFATFRSLQGQEVEVRNDQGVRQISSIESVRD